MIMVVSPEVVTSVAAPVGFSYEKVGEMYSQFRYRGINQRFWPHLGC